MVEGKEGTVTQEIAIIRPEPNELLIAIDNADPLPVSLVSELLSNLSKDYRRQNRGRTLVVSRIATGSLWIALTDLAHMAVPYAKNAVEIAKGGKAVLDFGKAVRDAIDRKKAPSTDHDGENNRPNSGQFRSVETLVKVAAETGSYIRVRQTGSDGSSLEVELSPADAVSIRERSSEEKQSLTLAAPDAPALLGASERSTDLVATRFADRLQDAAYPGSAGLVEAIVEALVLAGGVHLVEQVASQLEGRGLYDLATQIRNLGWAASRAS